MADDQKNNIFYTPNYQPDRSYESVDTFTQPELPSSEQTPQTPLEQPDRQEESLNKLTILLDVLPVVPESIRSIIQDITKVLIAITIVDKQNASTTPTTPTTPGTTMSETSKTTIPDIPDVPEDTGKTVKEPTTTQETTEVNPPAAEYETPEPGTITTETTEEDTTVLTLDDIFPPYTNIVVTNDPLDNLSNILTDSYTEDKLGLKEDYTSKMDMAIQYYIQELLCAANSSALGYDNLLQTYDGDAVTVTDADLKHLHDSIIRLQIYIDEKSRLFAKTHSADNTLVLYRALDVAYQQRKKYYTAAYGDEYDEEDSSNNLGYLHMASNQLLQETRAEYDQKYDDAVYQMYKYLNSACVFTGDILNATVKTVQAKAKLAAEGVNIFAQTPEPEPKAIGNTALVTPSVTAESDYQNRYETSLKSSTGSSTSYGTIELSGSGNEEKCWNYFINEWKINKILAAGFMGQIYQESKFDPLACNGDHWGICQWEASRYQNIGEPRENLSMQLQHIRAESEGAYSSYIQPLISNPQSIEHVVAVLVAHYEVSGEVPGQNGYDNRLNFANEWYSTH